MEEPSLPSNLMPAAALVNGKEVRNSGLMQAPQIGPSLPPSAPSDSNPMQLSEDEGEESGKIRTGRSEGSELESEIAGLDNEQLEPPWDDTILEDKTTTVRISHWSRTQEAERDLFAIGEKQFLVDVTVRETGGETGAKAVVLPSALTAFSGLYKHELLSVFVERRSNIGLASNQDAVQFVRATVAVIGSAGVVHRQSK